MTTVANMTPKGKAPMSQAQTQVITINGEAVKVTPAQFRRAAGNSSVMQSRIKTGRGADKHTYADLAAACKADYEALVQNDRDALERKFNLGRNLLALRALHKSDKAFGQTCKTYGLDVITRQDRNDLMWLAENVEIVRAAIKDSKADLASFGMSALRKRTKAYADTKGVSTKTAAKRTKGKHNQPKAEKATDGSSVTSTPAKQEAPAKPKAKAYDLEEAMSDAIEQAIAEGKTLPEIMAAFTKQFNDIMIAATVDA